MITFLVARNYQRGPQDAASEPAPGQRQPPDPPSCPRLPCLHVTRQPPSPSLTSASASLAYLSLCLPALPEPPHPRPPTLPVPYVGLGGSSLLVRGWTVDALRPAVCSRGPQAYITLATWLTVHTLLNFMIFLPIKVLKLAVSVFLMDLRC